MRMGAPLNGASMHEDVVEVACDMAAHECCVITSRADHC